MHALSASLGARPTALQRRQQQQQRRRCSGNAKAPAVVAAAATERTASGPAAAPPVVTRRALLAAAPALASWVQLLSPAHASSGAPDWAAVRSDIIGVIADPKSPGGIGERGPTLVSARLRTR